MNDKKGKINPFDIVFGFHLLPFYFFFHFFAQLIAFDFYVGASFAEWYTEKPSNYSFWFFFFNRMCILMLIVCSLPSFKTLGFLFLKIVIEDSF